jgi:hypothetical protein
MAVVLASGLGAGLARAGEVGFEATPGPNGIMGDFDDVLIEAPSLFSAQTVQLSTEFASLGLVFNGQLNDANEVLLGTSFSTPPGWTPPNLLAAQGLLSIDFSFTHDVFEVGAIIGISGGTDIMTIYDAANTPLGSVVGDDQFVSLTSATPIARVTIQANTSTTAAVDNLTFEFANAGPSCAPDLTTGAVAGQPGYGVPNGVLNNDDFFYYLAQFAAGNLAVADLTTGAVAGQPGYGVPNGVLNNDDFFYYLAIFAAGC